MDRIKRFIDIAIPTEACNLRCHYCYIAQKRRFNSKIAAFSQKPETIRKALSKKRLGGVCLLNFCAGGETLLSNEVLPIVKELLQEGHYVMLVTNGTLTKRFTEIEHWPPELLRKLVFKFSFHFLELKRLGWIDRFAQNVRLMKNAGASVTIEVTPSDELIPYIDELKATCFREFGALCHVTIARDDRTEGIDILSSLSLEENKRIWGQFGSALYDYKMQLYHVKRTEFCYAGEWSGYLNLETGGLRQCYCGKEIDNIYLDIAKPLHFEPIGTCCSFPYCYNGHAFIALGDIPGLEAPTYAEERNRVCLDGSEWLQPEMKAFMSSRLFESNKQYSTIRKKLIGMQEELHPKKWLSHTMPYEALRKVKHHILKKKRN